ncbi:MAG TPA: DUF1653 domain-containing protein [Clostridiales bacterium]|nr:DUF1653 domain-containing protein [Clostridiales bacterium]
MEGNRMPKPGEIYKHFKDRQYQVITVAAHSETGQIMVVYQALYGDFKTYVRPLDMFVSEVDHVKYPEVKQKYRFELKSTQEESLYGNGKEAAGEKRAVIAGSAEDGGRQEPLSGSQEPNIQENTGEVSPLLITFLDAQSYSKKLEVLLTNKKHLDDRIITDMAVALDLTVDEGPLEARIQELANCLTAMSRFEDRRLR